MNGWMGGWTDASISVDTRVVQRHDLLRVPCGYNQRKIGDLILHILHSYISMHAATCTYGQSRIRIEHTREIEGRKCRRRFLAPLIMNLCVECGWTHSK